MENNELQENDPVVEPVKKRRQMIQLSEEEMIQKIVEFKESGFTPKEYCKVHNYPMSNFYYWRNKYMEKFPEEKEKQKRGRKPRVAVEGEEPAKPKKVAKKKKTRKITKKVAVKPVVKAIPALVDETGEAPAPKRRGRPKSAARLAADALAAAGIKPEKPKRAPKTPKAPKPLKVVKPITAEKAEKPEKVSKTKVSGSTSIIIRYPNGTKISVDANIDIKKLKQLIQL